MTMDFIILRPEFFLLFGFLILLRYGTGELVTPYVEIVTIASKGTSNYTQSNNSSVLNISKKRNRRTPTTGPNHAVSALCWWAVLWCLSLCFLFWYSPLQSVFLGGCFQKDAYSLQLCGILFLTAALVLAVSLGWQKTAGISHTEYVYLAMLALMGQYLLILTTDLMAMYLCLELQSFSLVVLCGLNFKSAYSIEAAIKYFLLSAFRSCLLLLGIGFIYWRIGETTISNIQRIALSTTSEPSLLLLLGIWLVTTGLLWKLAAAPLHFWVPDVYMGAWSSVSLWITILPKIAVFGFWTHHWHGLWTRSFGNTLALFRNLSMIIGALAPLTQTNLKRLLAYSSINHIGLLLMPLCRSGWNAIGSLWIHMFIYIILNLGVWGLLMVQYTRPNQPSVKVAGPQYIWDLKGLNQSSGTMAFAWAVFMVGLRGLPPVYGFLGKAGILRSALNNALTGTVTIALITTLIGSVYYLKVLKVCYVDNPTSWGTPGLISSITAYIVATRVVLLLIGLWHGNFLFLLTHLMALKVSII